MMKVTDSLASSTHIVNIYFLLISLCCFAIYLLYGGFCVLYRPSKCILVVATVHYVFSFLVLGLSRSYLAFSNCVIWTMIVRGLQGTMPAIEMYRRNKEREINLEEGNKKLD